jgi:hypothetical protein
MLFNFVFVVICSIYCHNFKPGVCLHSLGSKEMIRSFPKCKSRATSAKVFARGNPTALLSLF